MQNKKSRFTGQKCASGTRPGAQCKKAKRKKKNNVAPSEFPAGQNSAKAGKSSYEAFENNISPPC